MEREIKVWGERWLIRKDSTHAVSYLKIRKGYRCSWHNHQTKYNLFVVIKGTLGIIVEELGKKRKIELKQGECLTIPPGQFHEFYGATKCQCIEEMYVEYDESDINRIKVGGHV